MATVRSLNAIKRRRAEREISALAITHAMASEQDRQFTVTYTVDTNGDVTASRHSLQAEALLDAIDALEAATPTAITIERIATTGVLNLT
jgi:hypothetical protein